MSCDLGLKMLEVEWEFLSCFQYPSGFEVPSWSLIHEALSQ